MTIDDALQTLTKLWPRWQANDAEMALYREKLSHARPMLLEDAIKSVRARYSSDTPAIAWVIREYDEICRSKDDSNRAQPGPVGYWVHCYQSMLGYKNELRLSHRFDDRHEALEFARRLPPQVEVHKRPRVTDLLGNEISIVKALPTGAD